MQIVAIKTHPGLTARSTPSLALCEPSENGTYGSRVLTCSMLEHHPRINPKNQPPSPVVRWKKKKGKKEATPVAFHRWQANRSPSTQTRRFSLHFFLCASALFSWISIMVKNFFCQPTPRQIVRKRPQNVDTPQRRPPPAYRWFSWLQLSSCRRVVRN